MRAELERRGLSRTIFFYVVREALFAFLVTFIFFFSIFFINQILFHAQQLLSKRAPFLEVVQLLFFSLPMVIALAAPFAALTGVLMTVGRLSSDNEILVMLSSGFSYRMVFLPSLLVGIAISLLSFFANDVLLPAGMVQYYQIYRRIVLSTPELELESNSVKRFKNTVLITGQVSGRLINDIVILDHTSDGERRLIMARNAELKDGGRQGLSLDLNQAFIQSSKEIARQDYDYASAGFLRYWVPQEEIMQSISSTSASEMSSVDVLREIRAQEARLQDRLDSHYARTLAGALSLESALREGPGQEGWNRRGNLSAVLDADRQSAEEITRDRSLLIWRTEFYKKFAIPFAALFFIFLAVPLGLLSKKSGQALGFFIGVLIAALYYFLLMGGQTLVQRLGYSPFWGIWFANALIFSLGLTLSIFRFRR
ncbi:MAG: LptF/LptG family permease [Treponema sp.]|jgi:lipopolysaccharide export system permease protein|nr:LptF/LptG family permease [Treponema sp.]